MTGGAAVASVMPLPSEAGPDTHSPKPIIGPRWIPWVFAAKTTASALLALLVAVKTRRTWTLHRAGIIVLISRRKWKLCEGSRSAPIVTPCKLRKV